MHPVPHIFRRVHRGIRDLPPIATVLVVLCVRGFRGPPPIIGRIRRGSRNVSSSVLLIHANVFLRCCLASHVRRPLECPRRDSGGIPFVPWDKKLAREKGRAAFYFRYQYVARTYYVSREDWSREYLVIHRNAKPLRNRSFIFEWAQKKGGIIRLPDCWRSRRDATTVPVPKCAGSGDSNLRFYAHSKLCVCTGAYGGTRSINCT